MKRKRRDYLRKIKSIMVDNYDYCVDCGSNYMVEIHHCIHGISSNMDNAEKYGLLIPLCHIHHHKLHDHGYKDKYYQAQAQKRFEEVYPELNFLKIFGRNYK